MASQALYGIMIAYPEMDEDSMIKKAYRMSEKMMEITRRKNAIRRSKKRNRSQETD